MAESMAGIMNPGAEGGAGPEFPFGPSDWTSESAIDAATSEAVQLNGNHWDAIRALQEYYAIHGSVVNVRELHDALDEKFHSVGGMKFLYELFPGGPVAQGCRFSGLKAPAGAASPGFGSVQ